MKSNSDDIRSGIDLDGLKARYGVDLLAANDALVARLVDEGRLVVRADPEDGRWLVPTLSGLATADGLAAASTSRCRTDAVTPSQCPADLPWRAGERQSAARNG